MMAGVPDPVDFFVSYTSADRPWAEWIAWELEQAGHSVIVQAWDMQPGSNFVLEMDKATHVAERTIAVLSPAFMASPYCRAEWAAAFRDDPMGTKRRLVPVRVREFEPDGLLGMVVYVDVVGLTDSAAREALLAGVASGRSKPRGAPGFPGRQDRARRPHFPTETDPGTADPTPDRARTVMVVYGRDADARRALFDMLRAVGLKPQEWTQLIGQTATGAPYAGEVLDRALEVVQAVVVLMTPDDEARLCPALVGEDGSEAELRGQPRPNVIFEAGLAFGRFPNHTILVSLGEVRGLSDLSGRQIVRLDDGQTALHDLVQRLRSANCDVDTSGTDWLDTGRFNRAPRPRGERSDSILAAPDSDHRVQVRYLQEDAQRWVRDRDYELNAKISDATSAMVQRGLARSSILLAEIVRLRHEALRQYRDEITSLRRRYNEMCAELPAHDRPPLALNHDSLARLARWRSPARIPGLDVTADIDDPTDASLEPDLRRFEQHGDPG
jgi:predicted nucleotide-binding protein